MRDFRSHTEASLITLIGELDNQIEVLVRTLKKYELILLPGMPDGEPEFVAHDTLDQVRKLSEEQS